MHEPLNRRGGILVPIICLLVLGVLIGAVTYVVRSGGSDNPTRSRDLYRVSEGSFNVTVPASGELTALEQTEIRNKLEIRATIVEIVDEGTTVKKGDVLMKLAEEEIRDQLRDAQDEVDSAENAVVAAESDLAILRNTHESELDKANLDVELAKLALQAWEKGAVVSRRQDLEVEIETAKINRDRLKDKYEESEKLLKQGFISKNECQQDEIALIEAQNRLEQAQLARQIYQDFDFKQQQAQKKSDVEQATAERDRTIQRQKAEVESARADLESKNKRLQSRQENLEKLQEQLANCVIKAPTDGLVVYATSLDRGWRNDDNPPEVGAEIRPNDLVMVLPNTSQLLANVKVNEALSGRIEKGQPATVVSDAMPHVTIPGKVHSISVLAEDGSWRDPNRSDYTVRILLDTDPSLGLKPSMRCKADIFLDKVTDVLSVPIQAVHRNGKNAFVYIPRESGYYGRKNVDLGRSSETEIEIQNGLAVGDRVLLRSPGPEELATEKNQKKNKQKPAPGKKQKKTTDLAAAG